MQKISKQTKLLFCILVAPFVLYFAIAIPLAATLSYSHRNRFFNRFRDIVEEDGGVVDGFSDFWISAERVVLAEQTKDDKLNEIFRNGAAGRISQLDLTRTKLKQTDLEECPFWQLMNVDEVLYTTGQQQQKNTDTK